MKVGMGLTGQAPSAAAAPAPSTPVVAQTEVEAAPDESAAEPSAPEEAAVEPSTPAAAPAEEELDPELAALMQEMEQPAAPAAPAEAATEPAEEELDPELAALMKQMEEGA